MPATQRVVAALVIGALLVSSCTDDGSADASEDQASFCVAWSGMQSFFDAEELPDERAVSAYLADRDAADGLVPDVLRGEWDDLVAFDDTFIDVLYSAGFDPDAITEPTVGQAFGSLERAGAAEGRRDSAVDTIDRWATVNCAGSGPDRFTFCARWGDIYEYLTIGVLPGVDLQDAANAFADQVAEADAARPAEVPEAWGAIADYHLARHDLLVTVGFDEDLISDELVADAFGSVAAAGEAEAAAAAAIDTVQQWSIDSCGGLCVSSARVTEALGRLGSLGEDPSLIEGPTERTRVLADLALGDQLMPDELREAWDDAADSVRDWVALWERHDFDQELFSRSDVVDDAVEVYRSSRRLHGLDEVAPEDRSAVVAWRDGAELPGFLEDVVRDVATQPPVNRSSGFQEVFGEIEGWVDANCAGVDGPGVVEVVLPRIAGAAGGSFVVVLGEVGSGVDDLSDAGRFAQGGCRPMSRSPFGVDRRWDGSEEPVRWRLRSRLDEIGDNPYLCEGWDDQRPVESGTYGVVIARYPGGIRTLDSAARPSHCLTMLVEVTGPTLIQLPDVPPCDIDVPESERWLLAESIDPAAPGAGTISLRLPDAHVPESAAEGEVPQVEVRVVALPAGTTLNQVGREQVAPSGAACVRLAADRVDREFAQRPFLVPLASLQPGFGPGCLDAAWLNGQDPAPGQQPAESPPAAEVPAVVLASGAYDLRLQATSHDPQAGEQSRCATIRDVVVKGDTIVDLPEFEECP